MPVQKQKFSSPLMGIGIENSFAVVLKNTGAGGMFSMLPKPIS